MHRGKEIQNGFEFDPSHVISFCCVGYLDNTREEGEC